MKAKKLIEVSLPIKEISAESVRDKSLRHGHISTLNFWLARRPLPASRAVVFASLVPDPLDPNCPQAFRDAVKYLLQTSDSIRELQYRPYADIPYTSIVDPMEDNLRNRLMMFIGKFSDKCQKDMIAGNSTSPKEQLSDGSLIKWENKNDPKILRIARELIWVAYNADLHPEIGFETHHSNFNEAFDAIEIAEKEFYSRPDRHIPSADIDVLEGALQSAIENFQANMPSVFDPFAGGGAIPLEAARLGCRSFGNDLNPVAHLIEKCTAEFPQKYGKRTLLNKQDFISTYGELGIKLAEELGIAISDVVDIPNRLSFDVNYYSRLVLSRAESYVSSLYPSNEKGKKPIGYYWVRFAQCTNPSCRRFVPMLKSMAISTKKGNEYSFVFSPNNSGEYEIRKEKSSARGFYINSKLHCPFCGSITDTADLKAQCRANGLKPHLMALIFDSGTSKVFVKPDQANKHVLRNLSAYTNRPKEALHPNSGGGDTLGWGISTYGQLFLDRQLYSIESIVKQINALKTELPSSNYSNAIISYLSLLLNRITPRSNMFALLNTVGEKLEHIHRNQAIPMVFDFPESAIFCSSMGGAYNQLQWIIKVIESESSNCFIAKFNNCASGDVCQFEVKSLDCVVTDPPYYDAMAYADFSDFYYLWHKRVLNDIFPNIFSTPLSPKTEECTALKHYHNGDSKKAEEHFQNTLTEILRTIEVQTKGIISIMFAHSSTKAWSTLCTSILASHMNISGSWPIDSERSNAGIKTNKAFLESSVTVACRPTDRRGFGDFKEVKKDIKNKVAQEVESLYELGFRGSDLLTACFGQAVSEFGQYETVEKADGSTVTVAELLEIARSSAFDALLKGIKADDYTRFYIGWLQMNGMGDCDSDDATKFTRVGVNVEINEIKYQRLLIADGNHVRLATAEEHLGTSRFIKDIAQQPIINQVHRAILLYRDGEKAALLSLIKECAPQSSDQFWRVLATLKELLPTGPDLKDVTGLLLTQETLRVDCQKDFTPQMPSLFDEI